MNSRQCTGRVATLPAERRRLQGVRKDLVEFSSDRHQPRSRRSRRDPLARSRRGSNALGSAFWRDLPLAAHAVASTEARVLVIAARGPHFTVGLDLKEFGGSLLSEESTTSKAAANAKTYARIRALQDSITSLAQLEIPVIAAVHGYCIGGRHRPHQRVRHSPRLSRRRLLGPRDEGRHRGRPRDAPAPSAYRKRGPRRRARFYRQGHRRRTRGTDRPRELGPRRERR